MLREEVSMVGIRALGLGVSKVVRNGLVVGMCGLGLAACGDADSGSPDPTDTVDTIDALDVFDTADTLDTLDTTPSDTRDASDATRDTLDATDTRDTADTSAPEPTPICVAVRGNGELITAHFTALARLAELYGPFEGIAGGSSASITSFLTESMHMNPRLRVCGSDDHACTRAESGVRLALMYKSLFGYLSAMGERDEAVAIAAIMGVVKTAQEQGIGDLVSGGKIQEAFNALVTLLDSQDVKDLVNGEVLELLKTTPSIGYHVPDLWKGISMLGSFDASDPAIFVRPGLVDFAGLAQKIGRIGSFYAGYGTFDAAGWEDFLTTCSEPAIDIAWNQIAAAELDGKTCGARFRALLDPWRTSFIPTEATGANRIRDRVGAHLRALVVTSVVTGNGADRWEAARADYVAARAYTFAPSFSDVYAGYWGAAADVAPVVGDRQGFGDAKTRKAMTLGQPTWAEALSLSPAEPGLARAQVISDGKVSAGGWPDLAPVLALKNAGCDRVVYVTRKGGESPFAQGIATQLGMDETQQRALFDLSNAQSSFSLSLREAAAVWCTDWNAFSGFDLGPLTEDAYRAPMEVHDTTLIGVRSYDRAQRSLGVAGCTPGVAPTP
jgi:hypothetical protein